MNTITIYRASDWSIYGGAWYAAFDEEGQQITGHGCSSNQWASCDLITMPCVEKLEAYDNRYPDGYEIKDMIHVIHPSIKLESTNA